MADPLSIRAAAAEVPDRIAIETATSRWTFADCAAALPAPVRVRSATPSVDTLLAVYAAFEARAPLALVHHRLTDAEQARQRALAASADTTPSGSTGSARQLDPRGAATASATPSTSTGSARQGEPSGAATASATPSTSPGSARQGEPSGAAARAVMLFTSGSTGAARPVALSRGVLWAAADANAQHLGWRDGDRWLLALSLAHAGGLAVAVRCLVARRPVVLLDRDFDRDAVAALLERCTLASLVPTQLAALLDDPRWRPPVRLRAVLLGGAAAPPALLARAADRGVPFLATYGMTETFGQVATALPARAGDPAAPLVPLPGVAITAGTRGAPEPIRIRGPMVVSGELETADLGFVEDGALHVVGRRDDVIVTGGENVHPAAVEAIVTATPGVRAACAFGVADERWGEVIGVAIVAEPGFGLAAAIAQWRSALPSHARPRRYALCDALPLLATGKVDRRAAARLPVIEEVVEERL